MTEGLNILAKDSRMMAAAQKTQREVTHEEYRCRKCDGRLVHEQGSWGCLDCSYTPFHGAD